MAKRRFTLAQRKLIKSYYYHQRFLFRKKTKVDCLEAIAENIRQSCRIRCFSACAGTFWFYWFDGTTTTHDRLNWWRMKKCRQKTIYPYLA